MYILYLDEFGHAGAWAPGNPRHNHHPLFGLAGFAIDGNNWKDLDRGFLRLKANFYRNEIRRKQLLEGLRPERYEPKKLRSRRDKRFASELLDLVARCNGKVFAYGRGKRVGLAGHSEEGLYTTTVQGALRQFEKYLRNTAGRNVGKGVIVMDRRQEVQNQYVLASAQSYLFARPGAAPPFDRLTEIPLLVPSEYYHGIQAADMIGRVVAAVYRYRLAGQHNYSWADRQFGARLDACNANYGAWRSVYLWQER